MIEPLAPPCFNSPPAIVPFLGVPFAINSCSEKDGSGFKVQRSSFLVRHTAANKCFFMHHWVRHKADEGLSVEKIYDCRGRSESESVSELEIEEVVSRYIRKADSDTDLTTINR
jgi:hypothetical protein